MALKLKDLNLEYETFIITKNESSYFEIELYNPDGNKLLLNNFNIKIVFKYFKNILDNDRFALVLKDYEQIRINENICYIKLLPEQTKELQITKKTNPLIMAIVLYDKEKKLRKEFQYKVYVRQNVSTNLY